MKTRFSHSLLNKEKVLSRLFLAYLFQDHERAMAFLQESRLSQSRMLCPKCANPMKMYRTQCGVDECIWRCYRIRLIHRNMRCSKLSLGEVMLPIYDLRQYHQRPQMRSTTQITKLEASCFNFAGMRFWRTWKAIMRNQVEQERWLNLMKSNSGKENTTEDIE